MWKGYTRGFRVLGFWFIVNVTAVLGIILRPLILRVPQQGPDLHNPPYRVWIGVCEFYKIEEVWNLGASGGLCRGFTMALVPSHARFVGTRCGNVKEFGVAFRDLGVGFGVYGLGLGGSWDLVPSKGGYSI